MSNEIIANLHHPTPILQQKGSSIVTTNPFIPQDQREHELEEISTEANNIINEVYKHNVTSSSIKDMTVSEINGNISSSVLGFLDDLFSKPDEVPWRHYLPMILQKEQRYTYFGVLLVFISVFMLIVRG